MYKVTKLKNHGGCQCRVAISDNRIDFISYKTRVISIIVDKKRRMIECTGTYSPTTSRQITYFLREYAPDLTLSDMKGIVDKGFIAC